MAPTIPPRVHLSRRDFRFELQPYTSACIQALYAATHESRGHVSPWMDWLHPAYSIDDAYRWVAMAIRSWDERTACEFLIVDRSDGQLAGCCGLNQIDWPNRVCNLGYWVRASKLRLGAASQSTRLLTDFGFRILGLNRLEIVVATGNHPSQRVARSSGALYEGVQRCRLRAQGRAHDAHMFALLHPALSDGQP